MHTRGIGTLSFAGIVALVLCSAGCGSSAAQGPVGPAGPTGPSGPAGPPGTVAFAGSGDAGTASHSDHNHFGDSWVGDQFQGAALRLTNTEGDAGYGLLAMSSAGQTGANNYAAVTGMNVGSGDIASVGVLGVTNGATGSGVAGYAGLPPSSSYGVSGWSLSGPALHGEYAGAGAGVALELANGAIRVTGNSPTAFQVTTNTAVGGNTSAQLTMIDNPYTNADPTAIVFAIHAGPNIMAHPVGVTYSATTSKWYIYLDDAQPMPTGQVFNVLVIKTH